LATTRVQQLRDVIIKSMPNVSIERTRLYTESMKETESEPIILRQAIALSHILENMNVEIFSEELIVGTIVEQVPGAVVYPEAHGTRVIPELEDLSSRETNPFRISDDEIEFLTNNIGTYWADKSLVSYVEEITPTEIIDTLYTGAVFVLTEMAGIGHVSINYPMLFSIGFGELNKRAKESADKINDTSKQIFYKATGIVSKAIMDFANRYAVKADELAKIEKDPQRRKELEQIAEICRWVPANPPMNFHEALQFIRFTHLVLSLETYDGQAISMGRIDQYLYPYYKRDLESGIIDREKAIELIESLWVKTNEMVPLFDGLVDMFFNGLLTTQAVTIGGIDKNGQDATNELTYLILEATRDAALPLPNVHVRIHKIFPPKLMNELTKTITSGVNNVATFIDEVIVESMIRKGIPLDEARNYSTVGCVELAPFGTSFTSSDAALFNIAICLELALMRGESLMLGQTLGPDTGNPREFKSIDDVINSFREQVSFFVKQMADGSNSFEKANIDLKPTPFLSLCVEDCFKVGMDITQGSARYNFTGVQGVGVADVADSLMAIDELVFKQKTVSMSEILDAMKEGFEGYESLRQLLLNKAPKYGNDEEAADKYAKLVARIYSEEVEKHQNIRGGQFIAGMYSVSTHVPFGYFTGALPSGRLPTTPISNGASPSLGSMKKGPTAAAQSVAKIDYTNYPNGVAFTMGIDPGFISGEEGHQILSGLIKSYAQMGGMQIQFNVTDTKKLLDAQENPDAHRDLLVRVAGYSAYFTELSKDVQNEIIGRFQRS
jgi:pyruvate formate-lyase/glycerol dehydratase family glycyl radical enzyme